MGPKTWGAAGLFTDCPNCAHAKLFLWRLEVADGRLRCRLPTDAEWEFEARARTTRDRSTDDLDAIARCRTDLDNLRSEPHPIR